jgi:hypothetical protein
MSYSLLGGRVKDFRNSAGLAVETMEARPRLADDAERYARIHRALGCRCWHAGVGVVVGRMDFCPALIVAEHQAHERTLGCGCTVDAATGITVIPCGAHRDEKARRERRRAEVRENVYKAAVNVVRTPRRSPCTS